MKLLDIMKKYDRCLVRESAKLAKIYNMILKESETSKEMDEDVCPDCGNDPCTCNETDLEEFEDTESNEIIPEEEFIKACDEEDDTNDIIPEKEFFETCTGDDCNEDADECGGMIPEEDFIREASKEVEENDMLRNRPHNAHINDPRGVIAEEEKEDKKKKKSSNTMSAAEFFNVSETEEEPEDASNTTARASRTTDTDNGEMMSAAEFFAEAEKFCEKDADAEFNEEEEMTLGPDWQRIDAHELLPEDEEKKLEESLKSYRRKNHRLFNG